MATSDFLFRWYLKWNALRWIIFGQLICNKLAHIPDEGAISSYLTGPGKMAYSEH